MSHTYQLDFFSSPIKDFFNYYVTPSFFKKAFEGHIVVNEFIGPVVLSEYFSLSFNSQYECEILTPTEKFLKTQLYERKIITKVLIIFLTFCN